MVSFTEMKAVSRTAPISILDIGYITLILMLVFLVSTSWLVDNTNAIPLIKSVGLSAVMLSLSIFAILVYLVGAFTKQFQGLKLITPMWLFAGLVAVPFWIILNVFLPIQSSAGYVVQSVTTESSLLVVLFGKTFFDYLQAVWVFAPIESIVLGILIIFFIGFSAKTKGSPVVIPVFLFIVGFMAVLHGGIALALDQTGSMDFNAVILHQFVSFTIFGAVFLFFDMASNIAFHQVKNQLALGVGLEYWVFLFVVYGLLTFLASRQSNGLIKGVPGGLGV